MDQSEFDKLSKQLGEKERNELLSKITDNPSKNKSTEFGVKSEQRREPVSYQQYSIARKEYEEKSFIEKMKILILSIFSGKKKEEVIIKDKLNKLKKEIQQKNYHLVNFENGQLTCHFLIFLIELVDSVQNSIPVIQTYFSDDNYFKGFVRKIFETDLPDNIKKLYKEAMPQSLKVDINSVMDKSVYLKEKERRVKSFISAFEIQGYDRFLTDISNYEKLIKLIKYNYKDLITEFSISSTNDKITPQNYALYKSIDMKIEHFYSLINDINFNSDSLLFLNDFIDYFRSNPLSESLNVLKQYISTSDIDKIYDVIDAANSFKEKVPLKLIIQYFKKDILFQPKGFLSNSTFLDYYKSSVKKELDKIWEDYYLEMRRANLSKLLKEVYSDFNFDSLEHCSVKFYNQIDKFFSLKVTSFYYLNLFYYFIIKYYKNGIEGVVNKILIDGSFSSEQAKFHLTGAYHSFSANLQKIVDFDQKLSYENEYGKKIMYYIAKLSRNEEQDMRRQAIALINEVILISNNMIKDMNNSLSNLKSFFFSITDLTGKSEKQLLNIENINLGTPNAMQLIEKINDSINKFYKIYKHIDNIY